MRRIAPLGALVAVAILIASCTSEPESDQASPPVPTISESPTASPEPAPPSTTEQTSTVPTSETPATTPSELAVECTNDWNTAKDQGGSSAGSEIEITRVRSGLHSCYQRIVFDLEGKDKKVNYQVEYKPMVYTEAKGDPMPIPGSDAYLQVVIFAPAQGYNQNNPQPGRQLAPWGGYVLGPAKCGGKQLVCGVRFGGTHEQQTTFAVGVPDRLPFRAWSQVDGNITKVVVDVAYP